MMNLHRLRILRELKFRGTLSGVAKALSYDASSISHQIRLFESELGLPLVEPFGRGVKLTEAAEILVSYADKVFQQLEEAEAAATASISDPTGTVRLATFLSAGHTFVLDAISTLKSTFPSLTIHLTHMNAEDALPALVAREFDLVVVEQFPNSPVQKIEGVELLHVLDDPIQIAVPEGYEYKNIMALKQSPWAMEPEGTSARQWAVNFCRNAGFEPNIMFESNDPFFHSKLVERGLAVAFLPELVTNTDKKYIQTVRLAKSVRKISVAVRSGSVTHPRIAAVVDQLVSTGQVLDENYANKT